ncbi:MAG: hypothetical protein J6B77_00500 [Clostridia bacterium]|nr:hypothetical protein [Clostridia bacterium]
MNEQKPSHASETASPGKPASTKVDAIAILRKVKNLLPLILCAAAALFAFALAVYFIVGPAEGYFHADCTDTILWAQATFDSGKVFNPDFNYAALLPFGANLWLVPLIAIFGVTMQTHVIGMIIFAVLFMGAIVFLLRRMKWSYPWTLGTAAMIFMILSSSEKLREIMWNHVIYYSLGLLLFFFMLALVFWSYDRLENEEKPLWKRLLPLLPLLVLAILNATNGFQMLVLTVLPIAVGVLAERIFDRETPFFSKKNLPSVILLGVLALGTLLGTALLKELLGDITSGYANAYSSYSNPDDWPENMEKFFMNWLTLIGMSVKNGDKLMEMDSIVNILRIGTGLLLLFVPLVFLACYRKIKDRRVRILVVAHAFMLAFLFFGCVCGRLAAANWRLTPLLGSSVLVTVAAAKEAWEQREHAVLTCRSGVVLLVVLALLSGYNGKLIAEIPFDYGRDNDLHVLAERLEEEGLTYGYATFWRSQAITLLSDSKVKVCEILVEDDGITTDHYQSQGVWYEDQEGVEEYFVLLSASEQRKLDGTLYWSQMMNHCFVRSFMVNGYGVFVFSENIWNSHARLP